MKMTNKLQSVSTKDLLKKLLDEPEATQEGSAGNRK
jgi:hypothetical protein